MTDSRRSIGRLLVAAAMLAVLGSGGPALAQQIDDDEADSPAQPMIRGASTPSSSTTPSSTSGFSATWASPTPPGPQKLDSLLTLHVTTRADLRPEPDQKKKLLLAGRGESNGSSTSSTT